MKAVYDDRAVALQSLGLSKSEVNRAGQALRRWFRSEMTDRAKAEEAVAIVLRYRAAHSYPLVKANMGLRSMVKSEGCRVEVSQRLKRISTIFDKLRREPKMALARMQDIGGCRAVLDSIDEVRRVEQRLKRNREPIGYNDYIGRPRASGYRGVHVIVAYAGRDGEDRAIEIQLRTRTMNEWAFTVERLSGRLREDLKSGRGPAQVLDWLSVISEAMAIEEDGEIVQPDLTARIEQLRSAAVPFFSSQP